MHDQLIYNRTLPDGRVVCFNVWKTGWDELVVPSKEAFDRLKKKVEEEGYVPVVSGYTPIK